MRTLQLLDKQIILRPIQPSEGFEKKGLATDHLDLVRRCAGQCVYCSTASTTPMRVNRARLTDQAREAFGVTADPTRDPGFSITWDAVELLWRLHEQLQGKPRGWLAGRTVMLSQLTDAFIGYPLISGLTWAAIRMMLKSGVMDPAGGKPAGRFRVLTKSTAVAQAEWIELFLAYPQHFTVGLSVGTLDDAVARRLEPATSLPSARIRALHRLQDAGVKTFAMLCPVFPDALVGSREGLHRLVEAVRPERVERFWWEPYNDRGNASAVAAAYPEGSPAQKWFEAVFERGEMGLWSQYAAELYATVHDNAKAGGWADKLAYLLYEGDIAERDASVFAGFCGVLLQSAPQKAGDRAGYSANEHIAALQHYPEHGRALRA